MRFPSLSRRAGQGLIRNEDAGKTEVFSTQIEELQADLQPWAAKIAQKQAGIDLATHERDLLTEKTDSIKAAIAEAEATLEKLEIGRAHV